MRDIIWQWWLIKESTNRLLLLHEVEAMKRVEIELHNNSPLSVHPTDETIAWWSLREPPTLLASKVRFKANAREREGSHSFEISCKSRAAKNRYRWYEGEINDAGGKPGPRFRFVSDQKVERLAQSHLTDRLTDSGIELLFMKCCSNKWAAFNFCGVFANWPHNGNDINNNNNNTKLRG